MDETIIITIPFVAEQSLRKEERPLHELYR